MARGAKQGSLFCLFSSMVDVWPEPDTCHEFKLKSCLSFAAGSNLVSLMLESIFFLM